MGKFISPIVNWISILFEAFIIILVFFPAQQHGITPDTMNYSCVFVGAVWFCSIAYYYAWKHKEFHGPKSNLTDSEYQEKVGQDVIDAILSLK